MEVVIEKLSGKFHLYNEAGQAQESDFKSYKEAHQFAIDNNYTIVTSFNNQSTKRQ